MLMKPLWKKTNVILAMCAPSVFPKIFLIIHYVIPTVMCMDIWHNFLHIYYEM